VLIINPYKEIDVQAVIYRTDVLTGNPNRVYESQDQQLTPLSPELFYPVMTEDEMAMWEHWLPTSYSFPATATYAVRRTLEILKAPSDVAEEFNWASNMQMFDEFMIQTPIRRDARDPLLRARAGNKWYRLVLWGESLLSLEKISSLVQESLVIKTKVAKRQKRTALGGAGLGLLMWLGHFLWQSPSELVALFLTLLTIMIILFAWTVPLLYTPENAQHDFLDCYRL